MSIIIYCSTVGTGYGMVRVATRLSPSTKIATSFCSSYIHVSYEPVAVFLNVHSLYYAYVLFFASNLIDAPWLESIALFGLCQNAAVLIHASGGPCILICRHINSAEFRCFIVRVSLSNFQPGKVSDDYDMLLSVFEFQFHSYKTASQQTTH
ncbi:hypothetical protein BY458DRAFT_493193 [Sporodiniella umbellata]|nr:hypothetical protein BY458DRAFT_493193 [Sporodiniella umbellata]